MYKCNKRRILTFSLLLGALLPLGAAAVAQETDPSESELRERIAGYWQARIESRDEEADYYHPALREEVTEGKNVTFSSFAIDGIELDGDTALVRMRAKANFSLPPRFAKKLPESAYNPLVRETWDRIDGTWYKKPIAGGIERHEELVEAQAAAKAVATNDEESPLTTVEPNG